MATTKKVAPKKVTQKKAAPKKAASSKSVKKTTKKTTRKITKKAVKKTVKKVTKKTTKKVVSKKVAAERTRGERTSFDQKLAAVEAFQKKEKGTQKSTVPSKLWVKKPVLRDTLGLSVITATNFPANIDALAVQTARLSGVAFVVLGGLFALNFSQYIWSSAEILSQNATGMPAQVVQQSGSYSEMAEEGTGGGPYSGMAMLPAEEIVVSTPPEEEEEDPEEAEELDSGDVENPSINIVVHDADSKLSDTVPVTIKVRGVGRVEIYASASWNSTDIHLGNATPSSDPTEWKFDWDTTLLEDGTYRIKTKVYNSHHPEGYPDSGLSYEINNTNLEEEEATAGNPDATLKLTSPQPSHRKAEFEIKVDDAEEIRLQYREKLGGPLQSISYKATETGSGTWTHAWSTEHVPDGEYKVIAEVKNKTTGERYTSNTVEVKVKHPVATSTPEENEGIEEEDPVDPEDLEDDVVAKPKVELSVSGTDPLTGYAFLKVHTSDASGVHIYALEKDSVRRFEIGKARKSGLEKNVWTYYWNTNNTPNGRYILHPTVTNALGTYDGEGVRVHIDNPVVYLKTEEQKQDLEVVKEAVKVGIEAAKEHASSTPDIKPEEKSVLVNASSSVGSFVSSSSETVKEDRAKNIVANFNEEIDAELQRFAAAYRSKDEDRIALAYERLETLKQSIITKVRSDEKEDDLLEELDRRIDKIVDEYKKQIEEVDTIIEDRISRSVFKDSDGDGITDYDEIAIFNTDPFAADTDGDGFNDGVEIENGYDPIDAAREVAVAHESPKEKGVVRADILKVHKVEPVVQKMADPVVGEKIETVVADISGVALPNSYVTIYIFSTPVVVTVKTDEDGAWRYTFDQELEDGEHNVYVGVTDNAGKIVAKSEPFTFVKEAQAFSPVDAAVSGAGQVDNTAGTDSLLSQYMVYLIVSISVVSIGLVLILLGLHLDARGRRSEVPEVVSNDI